jgi:hypothetical protein
MKNACSSRGGCRNQLLVLSQLGKEQRLNLKWPLTEEINIYEGQHRLN